MSETSEYEPQNDGESMIVGGNGVPPYDASEQFGYDDDDLDAAEYEEDAGYAAPAGGAAVATLTPAIDLADIELRLQNAEEYRRQREAAKVDSKVTAGATSGAIAAAIAATLPMIDGINLPNGVEEVIAVAIVLISTFLGGYFKTSNRAPQGLSA